MRNILCPVDFSDLSTLALRHAAALAKCFEGRLRVLHATQFAPPAYFTQGQLERLEREHRDSLAQAEAELSRFVTATLGPEAPLWEAKVVDRPPAEGILRVAEGTGAELIVMGTHGRGGINRFLLGSVAERVLAESRIPVLTVRGEAGAPERAIRHILAPVNDTAASRKALETAAQLARCFGARLTALHVREPHAAAPIPDLCAWAPQVDPADCEVREGEAAREIISRVSGAGCDLLVIGVQRRRFFDSTVIGTTSVRLVRHAPCPVLTVILEGEGEDAV